MLIERTSSQNEIGVESESVDPMSVFRQCSDQFTLCNSINSISQLIEQGIESRKRRTSFPSHNFTVLSELAVKITPSPPHLT